MPEKYSAEESVITHWQDGKLIAITYFNGHAQLFSVQPMTRQEQVEFYEVNVAKV